MEKRFLLATIISILILAAWTAVFRPSRPGAAHPELSQQLGNKLVTEEASAIFSVAAPPSSPGAQRSEPKIETIETPKFTVKFSNIGGTLYMIFLKEYNFVLPVRGMGGAPGHDQMEFVLERRAPYEVIYPYDAPDMVVRRLYRVSEDDYTIDAQTTIENKTNMSKLISWEDQGIILDMSSLDEKNSEFVHERALFEYAISSSGNVEIGRA